MNIIQIHNAIYNWLDRVGSPRFTPDRIDGPLNGIIEQVLEENYDRITGDPMKFFESNSRVRAILANLEKSFYGGKYLKLIATGSSSTPASGNIVFRYGNDFDVLTAPDYDAADIEGVLQNFDLIGDTTVDGNWTDGFNIVLTKESDDPDNDNWYNELVIDDSTTLVDASGNLILPKIVRNYNSAKGSSSSLSYDPYFLKREEMPEDMRYIVSFMANIEGANYFLKNITKINKNELFQNPYKEPTLDYDGRQYFDETALGFMLYCGSNDTIYGFDVVYIKNPNRVSYGIEHASTGTGITVATLGIVVSATATVNGVVYVLGDEVSFTSALLTAGTVVYNFVNTDLGESVHEEIAYRTAMALLVKIGDTEKAVILGGLKK